MTQTHHDDPVFAQFARITSALAAESRLVLLDRLCQGEQTVEQLAEAASLSVSNTSRHLRQLAECGLAAVRRDPPFVYYRVADDSVVLFWFALRELARKRSQELERVMDDLVGGKDPVSPMRRDELLERMSTGEVVVLDVRPGPEYRAGHIPGAVSVPLEELEARLDALPADRDVVAYCRGPYCMLAVDAVARLRERGLQARRLEDGFPEWKAAGLPVQTT